MTDDITALDERVANLETLVDELVDRVEDATGRDIPLLKGTLRATLGDEIEEIEDMPDAGRERNDQLEEFERRLVALERQMASIEDVATQKTSKKEKIAAICAFAQNKTNTQASTVAVTAEEIRGCVGVSRQYAYDLIDEAATLDGCRVREARTVQTGSGPAHKKKALLVDCERVHTDGAGVKQFTTGSAEPATATGGDRSTNED